MRLHICPSYLISGNVYEWLEMLNVFYFRLQNVGSSDKLDDKLRAIVLVSDLWTIALEVKNGKIQEKSENPKLKVN